MYLNKDEILMLGKKCVPAKIMMYVTIITVWTIAVSYTFFIEHTLDLISSVMAMAIVEIPSFFKLWNIVNIKKMVNKAVQFNEVFDDASGEMDIADISEKTGMDEKTVAEEIDILISKNILKNISIDITERKKIIFQK